MPTYDYSCDDCGHEFERQQRITADPIKKCPKCGKMKARRMIGGGGFILKGDGWESDLYSGPSNRSGSGKGETSSESSSAKSETSGSKSESSKNASSESSTSSADGKSSD